MIRVTMNIEVLSDTYRRAVYKHSSPTAYLYGSKILVDYRVQNQQSVTFSLSKDRTTRSK